jgi:iron(III) transport system permease protein
MTLPINATRSSHAMNHHAWALLLNTLILAGLCCAVSLPLGTLLGWLLLRTDVPGRRLTLVLLGLLFFVPLYLQAAAWQAGLGLQGWADLSPWIPERLQGWAEVVWIHSLAAIPWVTLITGAGFWLVEPELEEQALLDATPGEVVRRVTLRQAAPAVAVAAAWILIVTAGEMTVTDLFQVRTYAEEVYTRLAMGQGAGEAALGVLPGLVLTVALVATALWALARLTPRDRPLSMRPRWVFRLGPWRAPAALLLGAMLVVLVGIPLASLGYKAGLIATLTPQGPFRGWSASKCVSMVVTSPLRYSREFIWSLALGLLSATTAVVLAGGLVWWTRRSRLATGAVLGLAAVALATPGPLVGLAVIGLLNRPEAPWLFYVYDQTIVAPWLALVLRSLPLAILILWHALRTIPAEMMDAAAVDGAGPLTRFWRIVLPCRASAVSLAWMVALAVALGELVASILVSPPGVNTLSIRIFGLLHSGVEDQVAGICLALLGLFAAVAAIVLWLGRRWQSQGNGLF